MPATSTTTIPRPRWARTAPTPTTTSRWWRPATAPHIALALTAAAIYTLCTTLRYNRYANTSYDLAIFTEAVKAYAHGRPPEVPIKGEHFNILGDHLSPILTLLAPLWHLWPSPLMLLTAQAILFAWSVWIISDTAARHLGRTRGLAIGIAYALSFGVLRAIDFEFHEIAFATPLLAMTSRHLLNKAWTRAAYWALPLVLVKEDLGLTVATIGLLIALQGRRWATGALLAAAGLAATAAAIWWVIPHFNPAHHYEYWAKTDHHSWTHAAWQAASRLQTWKTIAWTIGITGMLAVRSPIALLALPTISWRMLSTNPSFWGTDWHYSATLMPIVFIAAVDTATRLQASPRPGRRTYADRATAALPVIAIACMCSMNYGPGDLARKEAWTGGPVAAARTAALERIPDGATVEATNSSLAALAARTDAYWYGHMKSQPPQYILFDHNEWDAPQGDDAIKRAQDDHSGGTYQVIYARDGITLLRLAGP